MSVTVEKKFFGTTAKGAKIDEIVLRNAAGMEVSIIEFGATLKNIRVPSGGKLVDVILGYDDLASYEKGTANHGVFVGRYANRIGDANFSLGGKEYRLEKNDGRNHLHGPYSKMPHKAVEIKGGVAFDIEMKADDEGYPGDVSARVEYTLDDENTLLIRYFAKATADTVINLTNHAYYNLNGEASGTVLNHTLQVAGGTFTETTADLIPTGKILNVEGTCLDFRSPQTMMANLTKKAKVNDYPFELDNNIILDKKAGEFGFAAKLTGDKTGISTEVWTTEPAIQIYNATHVDEEAVKAGKGGAKYGKNAAVCMETQHYPDAPNHDNFPTTLLKAGEKFESKTAYKFKF